MIPPGVLASSLAATLQPNVMMCCLVAIVVVLIALIDDSNVSPDKGDDDHSLLKWTYKSTGDVVNSNIPKLHKHFEQTNKTIEVSNWVHRPPPSGLSNSDPRNRLYHYSH